MDPTSSDRPSGTVTFLFTDVEGSTGLWAEDADAMAASLRLHDEIIRSSIERHGGYVFTTAGDAFCAAFGRASQGVEAALEAQRGLSHAVWPGPGLRVRMGLHLGEADERGGDYFGPAVNLAARLESAGHGGQILVSELVRQAAQVEGRDLGLVRLRDVPDDVRVFQIGTAEFPPLRIATPASTNLPAAPTDLIGRSEEVLAVRVAFQSSRLVTLVAGGGTGKTRLAIAVGESELAHRRDGVWFVDLTALRDPSQLEWAIAHGMELTPVAGDVLGQILTFLDDKDLLLILDNCEHLVDACAEFAEAFMSRPGSSVVLATSRESLDVDGEQTVRVPPLASTDPDAPAVRLFMRRAAAVNSTVGVDAFDLDAVVELCRRLDGLPLAIELAAARSTVLSPAELLEGIDDRFTLLHGGRRRQRQRVLESTLDWSYHLLDPDEREAFRALGVFVGTFGIEAAASVVGASQAATTDLLESLVAKSLVDRIVVDGGSRFRLFETTAAYAEQQMAAADESASVRNRHLNHFVRACAPFRFEMIWDLGALDVLGQDRANLVAAVEWATAHRRWDDCVQLLLGSVAVLCDDESETIRLIDRVIVSVDDPHLALTLHGPRFWVSVVALDFMDAWTSADEQTRSPDPFLRFRGNLQIGWIVAIVNPETGRRYLDAAYEVLPELTDTATIRSAELAYYAFVAECQAQGGDVEGALDAARMVLDAEPDGANCEPVVNAGRIAIMCHLLRREPGEALAIADRLGHLPSRFGTLAFHTALCHVELRDLETARSQMHELAHYSVAGRVRLEAGTMLLLLATLARAEGDIEVARELLMVSTGRRTTELYQYSQHAAEQLGIGDEYRRLAETQRRQLSDPGGAERDHLDTIAALRNEMIRRNWRD